MIGQLTVLGMIAALAIFLWLVQKAIDLIHWLTSQEKEGAHEWHTLL